MDPTTWLSVRREDGETVGYLQPLDAEFDQVIPRNLLGHPAGPAAGYLQGEELLLERGLSELGMPWNLDRSADALYSILEVSDRGIVVAEELLVKALAPAERHVVSWPDTAQRLTRTRKP